MQNYWLRAAIRYAACEKNEESCDRWRHVPTHLVGLTTRTRPTNKRRLGGLFLEKFKNQTRIVQERLDGAIEDISFDRGFYSLENERELKLLVPGACLPKRGVNEFAEQLKKSSVQFPALLGLRISGPQASRPGQAAQWAEFPGESCRADETQAGRLTWRQNATRRSFPRQRFKNTESFVLVRNRFARDYAAIGRAGDLARALH